MIEIQVDDAQVRDALRRLQAAAGDIRPALREVGEYLIDATRRRFVAGRAPDGKAWAPNSRATLERFLTRRGGAWRKDGRGPTRRGERLAAGKKPLIGESRSLSQQWSYAADARSVAVGTPMVYAATQQFGARKGQFGRSRHGAPIPWGDIPARPFLGLSPADQDAVLATIAEHLRRAAAV